MACVSTKLPRRFLAPCGALGVAPPSTGRSSHLPHEKHTSPFVDALAVISHSNETLRPGSHTYLLRWADAASGIQAGSACRLSGQGTFPSTVSRTSELASDGGGPGKLRNHFTGAGVSGRQGRSRRGQGSRALDTE